MQTSGRGRLKLSSLQPACLHAGIIFRSISLCAWLLIICLSIGVVENRNIQVKRNGERLLGFYSICEVETSVFLKRAWEGSGLNMCVHVGSVFVYMHRLLCGLLYCTVGRKGHGP